MINMMMDELEQARDSDYLRVNPWAALGIAIAAGMLIGFLTAKR